MNIEKVEIEDYGKTYTYRRFTVNWSGSYISVELKLNPFRDPWHHAETVAVTVSLPEREYEFVGDVFLSNVDTARHKSMTVEVSSDTWETREVE